MRQWTINCDLGEGMSNDEALMPFINVCNIACGGHAGDEVSMKTILRLAGKHGVLAGAHPSYPDRENFGRKTLIMDAETLCQSIIKQITSLQDLASAENIPLTHVKAHGALYNDAAKDPAVAKVLVAALRSFPKLSLVAPFGSEMATMASEQGFSVIHEAFADRHYESDGSLVSRTHPMAVIQNAPEAQRQVREMVYNQCVTALDGKKISIKVQTLCIHGDNPAALEIAQALKSLQHE